MSKRMIKKLPLAVIHNQIILKNSHKTYQVNIIHQPIKYLFKEMQYWTD